MSHFFEPFTNKYSLSKTLRFELIPVGKTREHINNKGLLEQDDLRAKNYKIVKKLIDEYHKHFIEKSLLGIHLEQLEAFKELYVIGEKSDKQQEEFIKVKDLMRKQIAKFFSSSEEWKRLFGKELIKEDLSKFVEENDLTNFYESHKLDKNIALELIDEFKDFTTYFKGFHENRKNIYTDEEIATAISYRLIHENLPKFIDNIRLFEKVSQQPDINLEGLEEELISILNGKKLTEFFTLNQFNSCLTQTGIQQYNTVLGGFSTENRKAKGLNEWINLYRQQKSLKPKDLPNLKPLYKQILSDRDSASWLPETFADDSSLLESIELFYQQELIAWHVENQNYSVLEQIRALFSHLEHFDLKLVFLKNGPALTQLSQLVFGDWNMIHKALDYWFELKNPKGSRETDNKYDERKNKWVKKLKYHDLETIDQALNHYAHENELLKEKYSEQIVTKYLKQLKSEASLEESDSLIEQINKAYELVKDLLNTPYESEKNLIQEKEHVALIKQFLDSIQNLLHFIKIFHPKDMEGDKDEGFYTQYVSLFDQLNKVVPLYNSVRNYVTQKPYSIEKFKLNFENSTLGDGWDLNKETDNTMLLFRKDGLYYLGIMDKKNNKVFKQINEPDSDESVYDKIVYKLLPGANKMLPKVFLSKKGIETFNPSKEILYNYKMETHKKGDTFDLNDCHNLIDYFKKSIEIHPDWQHFNFKFSDTKSYDDLSGFYKEVEQQGYKISFQKVSENYINQLIDEGKLYLFQIYNKDFSPYSSGKPNLHTLYWKSLFDENNLKDVVYKLNGQAEVFYRKASIKQENLIVHKKGEAISNKNKKNPKKESFFKYDITKDKRFALDKFQFHVPISMNFKARGSDSVNNDVQQFLRNNPDINIIGIDRGERHLLYLTLIDQQGNILKQQSLNEIINTYQKDGKSVRIETDYHQKLEEKEQERAKAREHWGVIENIKELKEGYLSHVIHVIAKMMVEHKAIVVLEDLNAGFKRGRQKVEKQVYQKFEKMLIDKLNYLVFKDKDAHEVGGALHALQLTNKFEGFKKINENKQSGFLFYVPAALTSKIDPITGFVDFLKPKYESIPKAQDFFSKFKNIHFNTTKNRFEFAFDYRDFQPNFANGKTDWVVCSSNDERFRWNAKLNQGKGDQECIRVTEALEDLLGRYEIPYAQGLDLKKSIVTQTSADFFKELMRLLSTLLSLRHNNGKKGTDEKDYILSPVEPFFNSLHASETQPKDADANGAYHIAKKGLLLLKRLNEIPDGKKPELAIKNADWLTFAQKSLA
jgi:CRISPR-associated protein Cpf1